MFDKSKKKTVKVDLCPGCGAPVEPAYDKCKYCKRPYKKKTPAAIIALAAGAGAATIMLLSLAVKFHFDVHVGGKGSE